MCIVMELVKNSFTKNRMYSIKFKLGCQEKITIDNPTTKNWLNVLDKIQSNVLLGYLNLKNKNVVVKFESSSEMKKDYEISKYLFETKIPNFMKYYCFFMCNEDINKFKIFNGRSNTEKLDTKLAICTGPGDDTGFIIMPYYSIGSIGNYHWNVSSLNLLKNVILQAVSASCCAYISVGFVHLDLHLDNIVLRKTKKKKIDYKIFNITLKTDGYCSVILDFGRAKVKGSLNEFKTSLQKMITLLRDLEKSEMILDPLTVVSYIKTIEKVDKKSVVKLLDLIQDIKIDYIK
jgi:serine/threonine protein kinase